MIVILVDVSGVKQPVLEWRAHLPMVSSRLLIFLI